MKIEDYGVSSDTFIAFNYCYFLTSLSLPHTIDNVGRLKVLSIECNYRTTSWDADIPTWTV